MRIAFATLEALAGCGLTIMFLALMEATAAVLVAAGTVLLVAWTL